MNAGARRKVALSSAVLVVTLVVAAVAQWQNQGGEAEVPRATFGQHPSPVAETPVPAPLPATRDQERARRTDQVAAVDARTTPAPARTADTPSRGVESTEGLPPGVSGLLDRWVATLRNGDVDAQTACYAPTVERFFRQSNVSQAEVRREKARMLARYPTIDRYALSDIKVENVDGDRATVSFKKEWDARGRGRFAGAERQRLVLQKFGADWKIVSEQELQVYWVKRS